MQKSKNRSQDPLEQTFRSHGQMSKVSIPSLHLLHIWITASAISICEFLRFDKQPRIVLATVPLYYDDDIF